MKTLLTEPELDSGKIRAFIDDLENRREEIELLIQKWRKILKAIEPEKSIVPKDRLIGHVWRYLYTVQSATLEEILAYCVERGAISRSKQDQVQLRKSISRSGTVNVAGNRYSLKPEKRADMRGGPGDYRLTPDELQRGGKIR